MSVTGGLAGWLGKRLRSKLARGRTAPAKWPLHAARCAGAGAAVHCGRPSPWLAPHADTALRRRQSRQTAPGACPPSWTRSGLPPRSECSPALPGGAPPSPGTAVCAASCRPAEPDCNRRPMLAGKAPTAAACKSVGARSASSAAPSCPCPRLPHTPSPRLQHPGRGSRPRRPPGRHRSCHAARKQPPMVFVRSACVRARRGPTGPARQRHRRRQPVALHLLPHHHWVPGGPEPRCCRAVPHPRLHAANNVRRVGDCKAGGRVHLSEERAGHVQHGPIPVSTARAAALPGRRLARVLQQWFVGALFGCCQCGA